MKIRKATIAFFMLVILFSASVLAVLPENPLCCKRIRSYNGEIFFLFQIHHTAHRIYTNERFQALKARFEPETYYSVLWSDMYRTAMRTGFLSVIKYELLTELKALIHTRFYVKGRSFYDIDIKPYEFCIHCYNLGLLPLGQNYDWLGFKTVV